MHHALLCLFALVLSGPLLPVHAQGSWPPPSAAPQWRTVISFEISAAVVTRRAPGDWADALPTPLLDRMAADEHFAAIDLGGPAGNGILVRFQFENMETYRAWNDLPEVQQLLAEIEQIIGYGYSRTSISMRRVASDGFTSPVTPRRNAPAPPPARPRTGERMASVTP